MTDTTPEVEKIFREMLMARSSEERIRMACSMFETARAIILASLPPGLSETQVKRRLFERLYAEDLPDLQWVLTAIEKESQRAGEAQ